MSLISEEALRGRMNLATETRGENFAWSEAAFRQVYLENYGRVAGVIHRLVGQRMQAEELANEVFWRLYRQRPVPKQDAHLGAWLYRTATNLGIDALRVSARRRRYESAAGQLLMDRASPPSPLEEAMRAEKRDRVRTVLASLKPAHAQILILRANGFSYQELAEILGVARSSVGSTLIRAETAFRKRYLRVQQKEKL